MSSFQGDSSVNGSTFDASSSFQAMGSTSLLDRDELECLKEWGIPFVEKEFSVSVNQDNTLPSHLNFMPENCSLFSFLDSTGSSNSSTLSLPENTSRNSISRMSNIPSLKEIAAAIKDLPATTDASVIMDSLLMARTKSNDIISDNLLVEAVAGVVIKVEIDVNPDSNYDLLPLDEMHCDVKLACEKPSKLGVIIRPKFVGQILINIKESNSVASTIRVLTVTSTANKLYFKPEKLIFDSNCQSIIAYNGNKIPLKIKVVSSEPKKFTVENQISDFAYKEIPPSSHCEIKVYLKSKSNSIGKLDIFLDCPSVLSTKLIIVKQIPLITKEALVPTDNLSIISTASTLTWGSIRLGESSIRSCTILNKGQKPEFVVIAVKDEDFRLIHNGILISEIEACLEVNQKYDISVNFCPTQSSQKKSNVTITRLSDNQMKQIGLLAVGGKCELEINKVVINLESNTKKIILDGTNLDTSFQIENIGDSLAFFSIDSEENLIVTPSNGHIPVGEKINIMIELDRNQIDTVLKSAKAEIKISSILITYGDELNRLRINRLYCKHNAGHSEKINNHKLLLSKILPIKFLPELNTSHLIIKDQLDALNNLLKEEIKDWSINVFISKKNLENFASGVGHNFVDLDATISPAEQTVLQPFS